jgi:hypothetical protein
MPKESKSKSKAKQAVAPVVAAPAADNVPVPPAAPKAEPEAPKVEPEAPKAPIVEAEVALDEEVVEELVLKCRHTHKGVTYSKGTPLNSIKGLLVQDVQFMQRRGTI